MPPKAGKGGSKGAAAGGAAASKRKRVSSAQTAVDEAAADVGATDALAETTTMDAEDESDEAEDDSGSKKQKLPEVPEGLIQRRLDKALTEKTEMATRVAELEKKLAEKDAPAESQRPATGAKAAAKVEHRLIL